jgi:hypothetical protein
MRVLAVFALIAAAEMNAVSAPIAYGEIVITDRAVDPASPTFVQDLKTSTVRNGVVRSGDLWRFHVVVLGNPRATARTFKLALYVGNDHKTRHIVRVVTLHPPKVPNAKMHGSFTCPVELRASDGIDAGWYSLEIAAWPPDRRHARGTLHLQ